MRLAPDDADHVVGFYDLGLATGPMIPAARGELGRVWRLPTARGVVAVKDLFVPPTEDAAAADVAFQLRARRAGVLLPRPIRRPGGRVLATLPTGVTVRAYEWMDLRPVDGAATAAVAQVGATLATLHLMAEPTVDGRHPWFVEPVGARRWAALTADVDAAGAPFAARLARLLPELVALEELLPCPLRGDERRCHLDLDDSNLARDDYGRLVVLDWENSGPASPVSELAMVVAEYGPDAAVRLVGAYRDAGGPAVLRAPRDFATAVAVQGHLVEFNARRWLAADDPDDRPRSEWRMSQHLAAPLTRARIARILADAARG